MGFYASLIAYLGEERGERSLGPRPALMGNSRATSPPSPPPSRVNWQMLALSSTIFAILAVATITIDLLNNPYEQEWIRGHPLMSLAIGGVFGVWIVMVAASFSHGKLMIGSRGKRALPRRPEARKERDDEDENF